MEITLGTLVIGKEVYVKEWDLGPNQSTVVAINQTRCDNPTPHTHIHPSPKSGNIGAWTSKSEFLSLTHASLSSYATWLVGCVSAWSIEINLWQGGT